MALKTVSLNSLPAAEAFVSSTHNAKWDGWDITTFFNNDRAYMHPRGAWNRDTKRWGFEYRYKVNSKGHWNVKVYDNGSK